MTSIQTKAADPASDNTRVNGLIAELTNRPKSKLPLVKQRSSSSGSTKTDKKVGSKVSVYASEENKMGVITDDKHMGTVLE
mmetsp:Transcript_30083/g.56838  ORF Transcript_30083/g.56838 Transcript_30083/m.56838 type:complete len:81 (-) Transcript_30083:38-280(-)